MEPIGILVVIFLGVIILAAINGRTEVKKKKIDAALRMEEMRLGYEPGTYSFSGRIKRKDGRRRSLRAEMKDAGIENDAKKARREQLKQGINDLEERLDNLQTIMESRREKEREEGKEDERKDE